MDVAAVQQAVLDAKGLFPRKSTAIRSQRGLRFGLPSQPPPRVASPSISLASAAPASTPTLWSSVVSNAPSKSFRYSSDVEVSGAVFPWTVYIRSKQLPVAPASFGHEVIDVVTDSPVVTVQLSRTQLGQLRVLVDNDGKGLVEKLTNMTSIRTSTAQAGGASTITLDSSASATNGFYFGCWLKIASGTGSGQQAQITAYVGSTKVATVDHAWSTQPDNTSVFEITNTKADYTNSTQSGFSTYYFTFDWSGERRFRHYRLEYGGAAFPGIYVTSALDSVSPAPRPTGDVCIWGGDSFGAGVGSDADWQGFARVTCDLMGWSLINLSIGGTGYLNDGNSAGAVKSFNLGDRWFPPANAWHVRAGLASTGSYTVTQSATTVTVGCTDAIATIQASFDTAFGSGAFQIGGIDGTEFWALGRGGIAASAAAMTANFAGVTNGVNTIAQYLGDLAPRIPKDGNGNIVPFKIVLSNGRNDTAGSNAAYTQIAVTAAATALLTNINASYPQAEVYMTGILFLPGGSALSSSTVVNCNNGISAAATASLKKINGKVPFIDQINNAWFTGTGNRGNLKGDGNSDLCCQTDATHPTPYGHLVYGHRLAGGMLEIVA